MRSLDDIDTPPHSTYILSPAQKSSDLESRITALAEEGAHIIDENSIGLFVLHCTTTLAPVDAPQGMHFALCEVTFRSSFTS